MNQASIIEQLLADPIANYPAATVACFDPTTGELPRRRLDAERTVAYLERLAAAGAPALLIAASTGHGHLRTIEELEEWFGIAISGRPRGPAFDKVRQWLPDDIIGSRPVIGGPVFSALLRPEDGA